MCTLLKNPEDESTKNQLHVYPMYRPSSKSEININNDTIFSSDYDIKEIVGNGLNDSEPFLDNVNVAALDSTLPAGIERIHDSIDSSEIGIGTSGIGLTLPNGSLLIECCSKEVRATTAIPNPNRARPQRITMTFYHHKTLKASQRELLRQKEIKLRNQQHLRGNNNNTIAPLLRTYNTLNYGNTSFSSNTLHSVHPHSTTDSKFRVNSNLRNQVISESTLNQSNISSTTSTTTCESIKIYTRGNFTMPTSTNTLVKSMRDTKPVISGPYQRWFCP